MSDKALDVTLADFGGWDSSSPDVDFFSTDGVETDMTLEDSGEVELFSENTKKDTPESDSKKDSNIQKGVTEKAPKVDFFSEAENEENAEEDSAESSKSKNSSGSSAVATLNFLKERGLADFELAEGEELDDDRASEMLEDTFESSVDKRVSQLLEDMPPVVKQMVKYAADGGDVSKLLNSLKSENELEVTDALDLEEVDNQKLIVRKALEKEGYDEDVIEIQIESLNDSGKLKKFASARFDKWKKENEESRGKLLEQQRQAKEQEKVRQREYRSSVSKLLQDNNDIKGLGFSRKDKKELPDYLANRSIKLQSGQVITQMQKDLYDALQDSEKALVLAKILKSDFDMSGFERKAMTKVSKRERDSIRNNENSRPSKSGGSNKNSTKSLIEYFS